MKKIFNLITVCALVFATVGSTFAYTPNKSDDILMEKVGKKVAVLAETNPEKLTKIAERVENILPRLPEQSRASYILTILYTQIMETLGEDNVEALLDDLLGSDEAIRGKNKQKIKDKSNDDDDDDDNDEDDNDDE